MSPPREQSPLPGLSLRSEGRRVTPAWVGFAQKRDAGGLQTPPAGHPRPSGSRAPLRGSPGSACPGGAPPAPRPGARPRAPTDLPHGLPHPWPLGTAGGQGQRHCQPLWRGDLKAPLRRTWPISGGPSRGQPKDSKHGGGWCESTDKISGGSAHAGEGAGARGGLNGAFGSRWGETSGQPLPNCHGTEPNGAAIPASTEKSGTWGGMGTWVGRLKRER